MLYTIKTQKGVEPKVDESVLKTTRCTKQSVNYTLISHIAPRTTPHSNTIYIRPLSNHVLCFAFRAVYEYFKLIFIPSIISKIKKKTTALNVPIVAPNVITSLSLTGNRDWVLCIEYEVFI